MSQYLALNFLHNKQFIHFLVRISHCEQYSFVIDLNVGNIPTLHNYVRICTYLRLSYDFS